MNLHEYLDTLTEQIRCKRARPMIETEISNHIHDQANVYKADGMEEQEAIEEAVRQMGDPIEAGAALDRVHRPKMSWSLTALFVFLVLTGMTMQIILSLGYADGTVSQASENLQLIIKIVRNSAVCLLVAASICILDYSILSKYPLIIFWGFIGIGFIYMLMNIQYTNGINRITYYFMAIVGVLFCNVIYAHRGKGIKGAVYSLLSFLAVFFAFTRVGSSFTGVMEFSCIILLLLSAATIKGWFGKAKKRVLAIFWSVMFILPAIVFGIAIFGNQLANYQLMRLKSIFGMLFRQLDAGELGYSYQYFVLNEIMDKVTWFGSKKATLETLPSPSSDYIITSIFSYFGILAASIVILSFLFLIYKAFHISHHQKNSFGCLVSYACTFIMLVKGVIYIYSNLFSGVLSQVSMPFLSYGLSNAIVSGILAGLLLSIYRNSNIISEKKYDPKFRIKLLVEKR